MMTLTLSASLLILKHSPFFTFLGLYLISVGSGSTKPCLLTFGADQFTNTETTAKASFFSWHYLSIKTSHFLASTVIVWIQDNYGWVIGFIIPTLLVGISFIGFMAASGYYKYRKPSGSSFTRLCQVIVAASRKNNLNFPEDISLLYQGKEKSGIVQDNEELKHTPGLR
jgi:solute carrier family 15 (peptide/histidine transporter), member 3/4